MNCIIIEDEKPAQMLLEEFISKIPSLKLLGVYSTALEAQASLSNGAVDLLFLDINLPLISGIDLLQGLSNPPLVIITTAYSEYAIEGFNLDVLDYLLKPYAFSRFVKATNKALKLSKDNSLSVNKPVLAEDKVGDESVILNIDKTLHRVKVSNIIFISSDKDYVEIQTVEGKFVLVGSLRNWEEKLEEFCFSRIHKSYVVNLDFVKKVSGNQVSIGDQLLPVGRTYKGQFMEKFLKSS